MSLSALPAQPERPSMPTWSIAYRSGGTHNCTWTRLPDPAPSRSAAQATKEEIQRGGRLAHIYPTAVLDSIGLPVGWEPELVDWAADAITIGRFQTTHVKAFASEHSM